MSKKSILVVCDVKTWGGWERAQMIQKHLSDEYDIDLMDQEEFKEYESHATNFLHIDEVHEYLRQGGKFERDDIKEINDFFKIRNPWETRQHGLLPHLERDFIRATERKLKGFPVVPGSLMWPDMPDEYKEEFSTFLDRKMEYFNSFKEWVKTKRKSMKRYDLIYLMFHTMLAWQEVNRMLFEGEKFISVVTGAPVVKNIFNNNNNGPKGTGFFVKLANRSFGVLCNNLISLKELRSMYKGPTGYIPRGVDPNIFRPTKPYWKPGDEFTVGFVGKEDSGKGLNGIVIPACEKYGLKLEANTRNYTNKLSQSEMVEFYNNIHVLVVASKTDGTPNPALEAAACGRPIVSVPVGNMPEFIEDGVNGFLVKRSIDSIGMQLELLKDNISKAELMGSNARQTVLNGWTWEHSMQYERKALRHIFEEMEK